MLNNSVCSVKVIKHFLKGHYSETISDIHILLGFLRVGYLPLHYHGEVVDVTERNSDVRTSSTMTRHALKTSAFQ